MNTPHTEIVVERARVRNWRSGNHAPYPGMLHDTATDERIDWQEAVRRLLWGLPEGAVVSIAVTSSLPEEGDVEDGDFWELLKPHCYGHHRERGSDAPR